MFDVARFWLRHGASGFRLDATPYLFEDTRFLEDPNPSGGNPAWLKPYNSQLPQGHDVLRGLRQVLGEFPGEPALLGESATATIQDLTAVYGQHGDEINMPMNFMIGNITTLDAGLFKTRIDEAQTQLGGHKPVFFFSSHDHARQWSSFGDGAHNDQIAKVLATLTLLQRGTAIIYYGEELGMGDMPQAALDRFPLGPNRPVADTRDKERTPMQWSASPGAGFSTGAAWLPVNPQAATHNAADEQRDDTSVYRWYAQMLRLRHANRALRDGAYVPLTSGNGAVLAFARQARNGEGVLVALNMSRADQSVQLSGLPAAARLLLQPLAVGAAPPPQALQFTLPPYGVSLSRYTVPSSRRR